MWTKIKNFFGSIWGGVSSLLKAVKTRIVSIAETLANDDELVELALSCVVAAAKEGLTGEKAWVSARDALVSALKEKGKALGNSEIDTLLQLVYSAYKKENAESKTDETK